KSLDTNQTAGMTMQVNYTAPTNTLERMAISQKVLLNATKLTLLLFDPVETSMGQRAVLGVTVTDGAHQVSYLFLNSTSTRTTSSSNYNSTTLVPIAASTWTSVSIDASQLWQAQGWAVPNQVTLTIFLQANTPGLYTASIRAVTH
ncbi:MAG TPA: hypothetical protein VFE96_02155, partial [Candidatus Bathyarchaeia archaeon]|nr:hypothetical protein [Candidatus Bathyarchaeia archaeon]